MKGYSLDQYEAAGCPWYLHTIRTQCMGTFMAPHAATGGKLCDPGCTWFKDGTCPAYLKLTEEENTMEKYDIIGNNWIVKTADRDGLPCYIYTVVNPDTGVIMKYWSRYMVKWQNTRGHGMHWGHRHIEWSATFGPCGTREDICD